MYSAILSPEELFQNLYNPDWIVLDCRAALSDAGAGRRAFERGHIAGAQYLSLDADMSAPIGAQTGRHPLPEGRVFAARLRRLGVNTDSQIVTYDDKGGAFAARAWWMLTWQGHRAAAVLDGGLKSWESLKSWENLGGPLETGPATPRPTGSFIGAAQKSMTVSAPYILAHLGDDNLAILDARAEARFSGSYEPIDPVAGHIPGALNYPFSGNLDAAGRFKSASELKARFADIDRDDIINMCGSGVTACHNMLARTIAGLPPGRLYGGSWSEWITDASRPIETGKTP